MKYPSFLWILCLCYIVLIAQLATSFGYIRSASSKDIFKNFTNNYSIDPIPNPISNLSESASIVLQKRQSSDSILYVEFGPNLFDILSQALQGRQNGDYLRAYVLNTIIKSDRYQQAEFSAQIDQDLNAPSRGTMPIGIFKARYSHERFLGDTNSITILAPHLKVAYFYVIDEKKGNVIKRIPGNPKKYKTNILLLQRNSKEYYLLSKDKSIYYALSIIP